MLKTPSRFSHSPTLAILAMVRGTSDQPKILKEGYVQIGHFSSDILLYGRNGDWDFEVEGVPTYGVCDSPEQFVEKFHATLEADPRNICVFFTHIPKEPHNNGKGGGWRWHKWGEYVGDGEPTTEYLDDEAGFEIGVYVFHVHDIDWTPEKQPA